MPNKSQTNERQIDLTLASAALALFWILFLWGWWSKGPEAFGLNMSVFLLCLLWASARLGLMEQSFFAKKNLVWIIPLILIVLSYAMYDNPFIKISNMLALPVFAIVFFAYAMHPKRLSARWGAKFAAYAFERGAWILGMVPKSARTLIKILTPKENGKWRNAKRAGIGIVLLAIISATIVAPLLGAADPAFEAAVSIFYSWLETFIRPDLAGRTIMFLILLIGIMSWLYSLRQRVKDADEDEVQPTDSLIAGIVISGVLTLYLIFLYLQISRLWVNNLPIDFKETENLVKSGFWQLFVLTILNIGFFFGCYKRTSKTVQRVLLFFGLSSLLLLVSAAWRMGLYVFFYGFSYEKFYASYAVVFYAVLLFWQILRMFASWRTNLLKTAVFLLLWMYALIAIAPVEQFILRANLALLKRPDSRLSVYELTMLSSDVLGAVERSTAKNPELFDGWDKWMNDRKKSVDDKAWYEMNAMNIAYLLTRK